MIVLHETVIFLFAGNGFVLFFLLFFIRTGAGMSQSALLDIGTLKKKAYAWFGFNTDIESAYEQDYDLKLISLKRVGREVTYCDMPVNADVVLAKKRDSYVVKEKTKRIKPLAKMWIRRDDVMVEIDNPDLVASIKKSALRSYKQVIEKGVMMGANRLLTLTFKENVTDLTVANKALKEFLRLARKRWPSFTYVCVPEVQKRGAVHYHLLLNEFYLWSSVLVLWRRAVAVVSEHGGGIFINRKQTLNTPERISKYIAKYVMKAAFNLNSLVGFNGKRYYSSKNIKKAERICCYVPSGVADFIRNNCLNEFICHFFERIIRKVTLKTFVTWDNCNGFLVFFELGRPVFLNGDVRQPPCLIACAGG